MGVYIVLPLLALLLSLHCDPKAESVSLSERPQSGKEGIALHLQPDSQHQPPKTMNPTNNNGVADLQAKEVLTAAEAAKYMGITLSYLYKLTMRRQIPHYKPMGKMCYFKRAELIEWLTANRVATAEEIGQQAATYCIKKGGLR